MATTTPNNIPSPDSGSNYDPTVHMTALADGVQEALTERANYGTGTSTEMAAAVGRFPDGAMWYNTTDNSEYRRVGGAWVSLENDTGWSSALALSASFTTLDGLGLRRVGDLVYADFNATLASGAGFTTTSNGNVSPDVLVGTINTGYRPLATSYIWSETASGSISLLARVEPSGEVYLAGSGPANQTYSPGVAMGFQGQWLLN